MQLAIEVKQALKQLPAAQRVVAIALKRIYEQIKQLHEAQHKQIDQIKTIYSEKTRKISEKSAEIIAGKKLTEADLTRCNEYFLEHEKPNIKEFLDSGNGIKDYWLIALENSPLKQHIGENDKRLLKHLVNIYSKDTENSMQITFVFEQNPFIDAKAYTRIIECENGEECGYGGDQVKIENIDRYELICLLFTDVTGSEELQKMVDICAFIAKQLIPYSLRFYLGEDEDEEQDEDNEEYEEEDQEEEEEEESSEKDRGRKKKH